MSSHEIASSILTLDPAALARLQQMADPHAPSCCRIYVKGGGCSGLRLALQLEPMKFEGEVGASILEVVAEAIYVVVDPFSLGYLREARLTYQATFEKSGFALEQPHLQGRCRCGSSFQSLAPLEA